MSDFRRGAANFLRVLAQAADPTAQAARVILYSKLSSGIAQLFARASDGTISQITPLTTGGSGGLVGDGSDGDVTLGAGTTTLVQDMFYNNLTVPVGSTLAPDGYRVFVKGVLTLGGAIRRNGAAGASAGSPAPGGTAVSSAGRPLGGQAGGGNGNAGGGGAGDSVTAAAPGMTASAGAGGAGTNAAGAGGTTTPVASPGSGGLRMATWAIEGRASGTSAQIAGGAGGGGGGGTFGGGGVGAIGGGGGAGGGYLVVACQTIVGAGAITANGGAGGNGASDGGGVTPAGGGGGGNGGIVVFFSSDGTAPATITANGGAAGALFSGGGAGNAGAPGQVLIFSGA